MQHHHKRWLVAAVFIVSVFAGIVAPAAAQSNESIDDKAPYYSNDSTHIQNESWMAGRENATLDNVLHYATRVGGFIIGTGDTLPSGTAAGTLALGLIVAGAMGGTLIGSGVGPVGGSVLGLVALGGLVSAGLAPTWTLAVALFGVGIVLTVVIVRPFR